MPNMQMLICSEDVVKLTCLGQMPESLVTFSVTVTPTDENTVMKTQWVALQRPL